MTKMTVTARDLRSGIFLGTVKNEIVAVFIKKAEHNPMQNGMSTNQLGPLEPHTGKEKLPPSTAAEGSTPCVTK